MNEKAMKRVGGCTGKGFVKGDSRIRRSSPRSFYELRKLALKIAGERVVGPDGQMISRGELLLRSWVKSRHPVLQTLFAHYAWGKPPEKIEAEGLEPRTRIILHYAHELDAIEGEAVRALPSGSDDGERRLLKGPSD
jgi:hypothetical protein